MKLKILILLFFSGCASQQKTQAEWEQLGCLEKFEQTNEWSKENEIEIIGYNENAMEPQISADEDILFFNNKPDNDKKMDIFYAVRTDAARYPNRYQFKGALSGANQDGVLDGTPAIDRYNNFYFVSTRDYGTNYQMIYAGKLNQTKDLGFQVENIIKADNNVTRAKFLNIDMGIDVSWDGTQMLISRADFKWSKGYPEESYLELVSIPFVDGTSTQQAVKNSKSNTVLQDVNWPGCRVYAASLSDNLLELYYTVFPMGENLAPGNFRILVAKRKNKSEAFSKGQIISAIKGEFTEAPTISVLDGGKSLIYHRRDMNSGKFKIYKVSRK